MPMLLGPLFQALFEQGVVLIATSNQALNSFTPTVLIVSVFYLLLPP